MADVQITDPQSFEDAIDQVHTLVEQHVRVGGRCLCGWSNGPMLDEDHRRHVAQEITGGVLLSVSQHIGYLVALSREADVIRIDGLRKQLQDCQEHLLAT